MSYNPDEQGKINIQTKEDITVQELSALSVSVQQVQLFKSANIDVTFYNAAGRNVKFVRLLLSGDDYTNWANDDSYIYNYVFTTLNLTPLPTI
jgi:hypothetical protein